MRHHWIVCALNFLFDYRISSVLLPLAMGWNTCDRMWPCETVRIIESPADVKAT